MLDREAVKSPASQLHDETVVEQLVDPEFAEAYLAAAFDETAVPGGQFAPLAALRHIAEAQGMAPVAEKAGMPRESFCRALSPRGNPTIKALLAVLATSGLQLGVTRTEQHA